MHKLKDDMIVQKYWLNNKLQVMLLSLEHGKQYSYLSHSYTEQQGIYLPLLCSVVPEQNEQGTMYSSLQL